MSGRGGRVLVVDEPPADAELFPDDRLEGFEVSVVPSRAAVLDDLGRESTATDCVVVGAADRGDLEEFLREVEERAPTVPVVVVTGGALSPATALDAGATAVVDADAEGIPTVLERRVETAIAAARDRREPAASAVLDRVLAEEELAALFDGDGRHVAVAGDRLADGLEPSALASQPVTAAFADRPSLAALLDVNYVAALQGERREREFPFGDRTYDFETIPVDGAEAGLLRVRPATAVSGPSPAAEDARTKLHRLHDIASELEAAESAAEIYELAIDCAERVLEFDACNISEVEDGLIVTRAATAPELDVDVPVTDAESGIAGRTIATGESYLVEDVTADEDAEPTDDDYRSGLSVPIGEDGVFQAISTEPGYYSETDLTLAELLVAHVANALDRVRFQEALTVERDHFAALFQNVPDAAVEYVLEEGADAPRIESVNSAFVRLFGYEPSEAVGESTLDLLVPEDAPDEAVELYEAIADGERVDREVTRATADGTRPFLLRSVPVTSEEDRGGYLIYTDLSELKARERELRAKNERLDRFASVVSHDLRNPLSVASAYVEQARETGDLSLLDEVERGHERTFDIIDDVLALARAGGAVSDTSSVDLAAVAADAWDNVDTDGAVLEVEATRTLEADRSRLRQLLENCFRNSVEHGSTSSQGGSRPDDSVEHGSTSPAEPSGSADAIEHGATPSGDGELTVTVGDATDGFVVADDGAGFPDDVDPEQLFDYGYTTAEDGTGFGLSIVTEIAEGHGWSVAAQERDDGGAAFRFEGVGDPAE